MPLRKRRKGSIEALLAATGKLPEELEPLFPKRGRIERFLRGQQGEPSDEQLQRAKVLATLGTTLNPATAPLNEATVGTIEGALLSRGTTRDELARQEEERKRQRFRGSRLGSLESLQPSIAPANLGGSLALQGSPFAGGGGSSIASALGAPGGGTPQAPFSVNPLLEPLRLGRRNLRRRQIF